MNEDLCFLSLFRLQEHIKSGDCSTGELLDACLARIDQREPEVQAWQALDKDILQQRAAQLDGYKKKLSLHGIPVGLKDVINTGNWPTTYGSDIFADYYPPADAPCVERLEAKGALLMGKTVSTEFAYMSPGKTRNPHNPNHTPGGSSSGSAAAVADYHVPAALGTQTAGSIIRPASFCGVVGYKPSTNSFPFEGVHPLAPSFDTLGGFTRSVTDMILLRNALAGNSMAISSRKPAKIYLLRGPYWRFAEPETVARMDRVEQQLEGMDVELLDPTLPGAFGELNEAHLTVMLSECVVALSRVYEQHARQLSDILRADYERGMAISESELQSARDCIDSCKVFFAELFRECDLVVSAAATGYAPAGLGATGDPVFNRAWTALNLPCLSLPTPRKKNELPVGLQLVGALHEDRKLLQQALWFEELLA